MAKNILPKRRWPDVGYRLGMTFAQTCQTRERRDKRDKGRRKRRRNVKEEEGESVRRKAVRKAPPGFKIAVFCSRQRSTSPDKPDGTTPSPNLPTTPYTWEIAKIETETAWKKPGIANFSTRQDNTSKGDGSALKKLPLCWKGFRKGSGNPAIVENGERNERFDAGL